MHRNDALALARSLMDAHGLHDWTITLDRAKSRAGICRSARRQIGLSAHLVDIRTDETTRLTILHEIAHALVGNAHGHDAVWQAKCLSIGGDGRRQYVPSATQREHTAATAKWHGVCPNGHEVYMHRAPLRVTVCGRCCPGPAHIDYAWTWYRDGKRMHAEDMPARFYAEWQRLMARHAPTSRRDVSDLITASIG